MSTKELSKKHMMDNFSHYDDDTGEYIETQILHVEKPEDLKMPVLDGIERTMNLNITRASGWHYADNTMLFIPAYRKVSGQSLTFKIGYLTDSGSVNKDGIVFEFSSSRSFARKIALVDVLSVVFNVSDADTIRSMIGVDSELLTDKYINPRTQSKSKEVLKYKDVGKTADLSNKFKTILTTQTMLEIPARLYRMLSISNFVGHSLAYDTVVGNLNLPRFKVLTEMDAFHIEHSGLTEIKLLTPNNKLINVTLIPEMYTRIKPNTFNDSEIAEFKELEAENNNFAYEGEHYSKKGLPRTNTLEIYCAVINRLLNFPLSDIQFSMQDYGNQRIVDFSEKIADFRREDLESVYNNLDKSSSFLEAIQSTKLQFQTDRALELIKNADSSLAVISKNENPLAKTSNGNVLVRDVTHLSKEVLKVLPQDLGISDPVDSAESKNIGKTTPLTMTSEFNEVDGSLYTHLYKVENGQLTGEIEKVHVKDLPTLFVAEHGAELEGHVMAKHKGEAKLFPIDIITHTRVSPFSTTSVCRGSSAFLENTDQKRTQMTANAQKQARAILRPKRALIETGVESIAANGDTGLKHIYTVQEIFDKYNRIPKGQTYDIGEGPFTVSEVANLGMSKEYLLASVSQPHKTALFNLTTEKSSYGAAYYYELVAPANGGDSYLGHEIVYKQHNIVIGGSVEATDRLDYHTKGDSQYFNLSVANGQDLFVMFGFRDSFTVDDASEMSDRVVRDMSLATPVLITKSQKKYKIKKGITEHRGLSNSGIPQGFNEDGLPNIGTYLRPGAVWLYRYEDSEKYGVVPRNMSLDHEEHGEVINVVETANDIRVTIAKWVNVNVGDKFSARHGNKTIVAKVTPHEQMPYDPISGRHVDMIINPLGIPSRGNISQLAELQASAEVYASDVDTKIIPPFSNELMEMVENYEQGKDLTEIQFINPKTGLYYPEKHFCGYMHYLRNAKIAEDQLHAIGDSQEIDAAYLQPVGGSGLHEKGQSISSMEKEILLSYGADGLLDEIHGVLSSDREGYSKISKELEEDPGKEFFNHVQKNIQAESMRHAALAFHSIMRQEGEYVKLDYLTDADMEQFQPIDLDNINYSLDNSKYKNTMMYIPLSGPIITPVAVLKHRPFSIINVSQITESGEYMKDVTYGSDSEKVTFGNLGDDRIESIINGRLKMNIIPPSTDGGVPIIRLHPSSMSAETLKNSDIYPEHSVSGMAALIKLLRDYPMELWVNKYERTVEADLESLDKSNYPMDDVKRLAKFQAMVEDGGFEKYITTRFPVLPNKYRRGNDGRHADDSITKAYGTLCRNHSNLENFYTLSRHLLLPSNGGKNRISLFEFFAKKDLDGRIRGKILKTRVLDSLRSTIVPMFSGDPAEYGYPEFAGHPNSIGLPLVGALRLAQPHVVAYLKSNYADLISRIKKPIQIISHVINIITLPLDEAAKLARISQEEIAPFIQQLKKDLKEVVNGRYVFYGRAPSLHETSLRGGQVYVHEQSVIHLHSLLTTDLNADHDGDQIYVVMPLTNAAIEDIKTKLLPTTKSLRYNDGKPSLPISQDAVLGLYFATAAPVSETVRPVRSIKEIEYNIKLGLIQYNDLVTLPIEGGIVYSTAGRILVNNVIYNIELMGVSTLVQNPETGFYHVPYDCVIAGNGSFGNTDVTQVQLEIANRVEPVHAVGIYNKLQQIGYQAVERRNLTVGIKDLTPSLLVKSVNEEIKVHVENARTLEELGMLPEDYIIDLDNKLNNLIDSLDIMSLVPEDNAFKILAKSGAKGKPAGIVKMFGVQGFIADNAGGKLPTPLLSNTVRGLSQFQVEELSYTQRDNAISTVFETSKPGETLRSGAFELAGLFIQEDTDANFIPQYVPYQHRIEEIKDEKGKVVDKIEPRLLHYGQTVHSKELATVENCGNLTYRGQRLTQRLLSHLANATVPFIELDNEQGYLFPDVEIQEVAYNFFPNKFTKQDTFLGKKYLDMYLKEMPKHLDIKTHLNEFSLEYGISESHAGTRAGEVDKHVVGSNIGIKASTATAQPANQLVISKRNMERAGGGLDNGIDMFKAAIQNANFHGNDRNKIELLAPCDGSLSVTQTSRGYLFRLSGYNGLSYIHEISIANELEFDFIEGTYPVFLGQTVLSPKSRKVGERLVHPRLSFAWSRTNVPGVNLDFKDQVVNPSADLIQLARYYVMVYIESIYRENGIKLHYDHYGCFALQLVRHVYTIHKNPEMEHVNKVGFLNTYYYVHDVIGKEGTYVVNLELTNSFNTIMLTAGPVAAMTYRDSHAVISSSASKGYLREFGGLSKIALGVNLKESVATVEINENSQPVESIATNIFKDEVFIDPRIAEIEKAKEAQMGSMFDDIFGGGSPVEAPTTSDTDVREAVDLTLDLSSMFGDTTSKPKESIDKPSTEESGNISAVGEIDLSNIFGGGKNDTTETD